MLVSPEWSGCRELLVFLELLVSLELLVCPE